MFVDDDRLVEIPNYYVLFMKKDEYAKKIPDLHDIAKRYERDIQEKTELLKAPPPMEPLSGADTSAKTMRKQVLVVLDNSEQYLIKVRKAIADLEKETATWDRAINIPKCLAQARQSSARTEGSRENQIPVPARTTSLPQGRISTTTPTERLARPIESLDKQQAMHSNAVKELDKMSLLIDQRNAEQVAGARLSQTIPKRSLAEPSEYLLPESSRRTTGKKIKVQEY